MIPLQGKIAMVTGGARGIGECIARTLAAGGANLALVDMDGEGAAATAEKISAEFGIQAIGFRCNVTDGADVEAAVKKIVTDLGGLSVLVNNAGITRDKLIMRMTEEDWRMVLDVNLTGTFLCTKSALKPLSRCSGSIVNVASVIGLMGNAGQSNYAASKAGIIGFTKSVAKEYSKKGVRVNAVAPGFIDTAMTHVLEEEYRRALLERIPLGRMGTPEEVANLVAFLASDLAQYITGQVIAIDGGMVM